MKKILAASVGLVSMLCLVGAGSALAQSGGGGKQMAERFQMLDDDGDGQITQAEIADWHDTVFVTMDADENENLTREEYMAIQLGAGADPDQRGPRYAERQAEKNATFTSLDADGDGQVPLAQYLAAGSDLFASADANSDGSLTMPEFMAAHWAQR